MAVDSFFLVAQEADEQNKGCSRPRKRLLFAELQDMSKEQLLGSLSEFCASRGKVVDELLSHNQKRRSSERRYTGASFYRVFEASEGSLLTVGLLAGPLGAHVLAMTSARTLRMYWLCRGRLEAEWRALRVRIEAAWSRPPWKPTACERYYLWHSLHAPYDKERTGRLLASLATGSDEACGHVFLLKPY